MRFPRFHLDIILLLVIAVGDCLCQQVSDTFCLFVIHLLLLSLNFTPLTCQCIQNPIYQSAKCMEIIPLLH